MRVDLRAIGGLVGSLLAVLSLTLLLPAAVALLDGDALAPFLVPLAGGLVVGLALRRLSRNARPLRAHDGFLAVALVWLAAAVLAAVPYMIEGGDVSEPADALFEAMAGVTATGASNMADIESHGRAILLWRSLTQWLGGLGIIVLVLAVLPRLAVGGRQLMSREVPGPQFDKLAPRMRDTAKRFWLLYAVFTGLEMAALTALGAAGLAPGMDLYNAVCHSFTTLSAGGFSPNARSIEPFGAWAQWTIALFIVVAGTNFALWYRGLFRGVFHFRRDEELRLYLGLILAGSAVLAVELYLQDIEGLAGAVRHGFFQTASIMTGTGYASTDYAEWTSLTFSVLLLLMFVGGMAGSPTGALKVARHLLIWKFVRRELHSALHPQAVLPLRVSGRPVDDRVLQAAVGFTLLYALIFVVASLLLLLDASRQAGAEIGLVEAFAAAAATLGNVGPGLGFAGPMGSYAEFTDGSKLLMCALMWMGRLELIPILVLLTRAYWRS
jgi:trk system potassium uptake protein TrkH